MSKALKKVLKIFLWVVVSIVGLLLLLSILLYLPPVQNFIKDKAAQIVSQSLGMNLSIGKIRLRFPLTLTVDNATVIAEQGDTLARVGQISAGVLVTPLLAGEIVAPRIVLENAYVNYNDTVSNMGLSGTLGQLIVTNTRVRLSQERANIGSAKLERTSLHLSLGQSVEADTTTTDTTAVAWKIRLRQLDIDDLLFTMETSPEVSQLSAAVGSGRLSGFDLDMSAQEVTAGLLRLDNGVYSYLTDSASVAVAAAEQPADTMPEEVSLPWTVRLAALQINDNAATYGAIDAVPSPGFDPSHIEVSGLSVRLDSIYNRGAEITAVIRSLELRERSGLEVREAQGAFSMDSATIALRGLDLRTAASRIQATATADAAALRLASAAAVSATLTANLGPNDIFLLYPAAPAVRQALAGKPLVVTGEIAGTLGNLNVRTLRAQIQRHIDLRLSGNVRSVTMPERLAGTLRVDGTFANLDFIKGLLPDTTMRSAIGFPERMTLNGMVAIDGDTYSPDLVLAADSGRIVVSGVVDLAKESYDADLAVDNFPLGTFLPMQSLGILDLSLTAQGSGFDPSVPGATTDILLNINRFDYNDYDFTQIKLDAALKDSTLTGSIASASEALELNFDIHGEIYDGYYSAMLKGGVDKADLYAMHLSDTTMAFTFDLQAGVSADMADSTYTAGLVIDSMSFAHGIRVERLGRTTLDASADRSAVTADLRSGDIIMNFVSPVSLASLTSGLSGAMERIMQQVDSLDIDVAAIQDAMPPFRLDASAGRNNALRTYMRSTGMDFNRLSISAGAGTTTPLGAGIVINGLRTGEITLDTLNIWMRRQDDKLGYAVRLRNRPGNTEQMALIFAYGSVAGNSAQANLIQHNRSDSTGFRFGVNAQLTDSMVRATLTPQNPVFGYANWSVNDGNYLEYHFDKRIYADLRLQGSSDDQFLKITSVDHVNMPRGSVRLDMDGIDLGEMFSLFPAPPPIEGTLSCNGTVGLADSLIKGDVTLGINDLIYDQQSVGDITFGATANTNENNVWALDLHLSANEATALTARGTYDPMGAGAIDMQLNVPKLPLTLVNPFLPRDMAQLAGTLDGSLSIEGTIANPDLEGGFGFSEGRITVPMIGTSYGISGERIVINNNQVTFRDFGLVAPNNQKLSLDGNVNIRDFAAISANLRLYASNFEAVNSARRGGSQVYGIAALDADVRLQGRLNAMSVKGSATILNRTDIYYTMRDSPLEVGSAKQDIVTFVSFADEVFFALQDSAAIRRQSGIDVLVSVNMQDGVEATVNLSEDGNNRIELEGEGNLAYAMNNQGDMRLTGRYTLSGGTVVYNLPVIGQKNFSVDEDSYVQFTGELANPAFNIKATEVMPIRVVKAGSTAAQEVNFNIMVNISNTLKDMDLTFDASTADRDISPQLDGLTPEERSSQAIFMLVSNRYTGPGATTEAAGGFDVNSALNSFISQELNQWARNNLQGVELSVGINTVDDATGGQHTDYSYSVSKSLLNDRLKVSIGGSVSDNATSASLRDNFVDDISLEYRLAKRDNMFLKLYRYTTQESLLEGQVVETGGGFLVRRKMNRLNELFRFTPDPQKREVRQQVRDARRQLRTEELLEADSLGQRRRPWGPREDGEPDDTTNMNRGGRRYGGQGSAGSPVGAEQNTDGQGGGTQGNTDGRNREGDVSRRQNTETANDTQ